MNREKTHRHFGMPTPPGYQVDWDELDARFDWISAMRGVEQDPIWHAEGDVWIHSRMVCEALVGLSLWRTLEPRAQRIVWLGALFHDIAKPYCTRIEDGRIRSPNHSPKGAIHARRLMWEVGIPFDEREEVCGLVRHHQLPFHALSSDRRGRRTSGASFRCRLRDLALLAEADMRGRECPDKSEKLDAIGLFEEFAKELGCWDSPRTFPSDHTRVLYFRNERPANVEAYDDTQCTVVLMSGLPATGKTTWRRTHRPDWPVVSLDEIRQELGVSPAADQGRVKQAATERARSYLRAKRDFVWDATNLDPLRRQKVLRLCADYRARVEVVVVETTPEKLHAANDQRSRPVPRDVVDGMLRHWIPPDLTEAHRVLQHAR